LSPVQARLDTARVATPTVFRVRPRRGTWHDPRMAVDESPTRRIRAVH
jgi:hypothetical protein